MFRPRYLASNWMTDKNVVHSNPYEDFANEFNDYTNNVYENPVYHYDNGVMVPNYGYESSFEFCWKFYCCRAFSVSLITGLRVKFPAKFI
jgi:hypothetical protein